MTAPPRERLYTPELLGLATGLAHWPLDEAASLIGEARSRTCGSTIRLSLELDDSGAIARLGMRVSACAVGQAAAAIFAEAAMGRDNMAIADALAALEAWLEGEGAAPEWPGLAALVPARDFPSRHGAILLPWKAALDALCKADVAS